MPTTVEDTKTLVIDDMTIEMRPLKIKKLRAFMKEFDGLKGEEIDNDKSLDVLIKCCAIAMQQYNPELAKADMLEELLDITDVYNIIEAATGIRLGDASGNLATAAPLGMS